MNFKTLSLTLFAALIAIPVMTDQTMAQGGRDNPLDPTPSRSQVLVGPRGGVTRNYHTGGFRTIDDPGCPVFEEGSGWGFLVGLTAEFLPVLNGHWGIIPAVTFEQRPGHFFQELPNAKVLLNTPTGPEVVDQTVTTTSDITYSLLNIEVLYKQEFVELGDFRVSALAGPAFQYVMGGTNRQVQDLVEPENARFINPDNLPSENSGRTLIFFNDDIPSRSATRFSVKGGIQGEIGLFDNAWILTPGVFYDYGITDVTPEAKWQVSSVIFQADLRRAF